MPPKSPQLLIILKSKKKSGETIASEKKRPYLCIMKCPTRGVFRSTVRGCRSHLFGCFFSYAPALSTSGAPQETVKQNKPKQ